MEIQLQNPVIEKLQKENTLLRAALASSKDPCMYCQLPADEMSRCRAGFPGCARADDLSGCPEFGASVVLHDNAKFMLPAIVVRVWEWVDSMGWHEDKRTLEYLALIGSEVGEACNEVRGAVPTDKFGSELADIIIRTLDLSAVCNINIAQAILDKMAINEARGNFKGRTK